MEEDPAPAADDQVQFESNPRAQQPYMSTNEDALKATLTRGVDLRDDEWRVAQSS